MPSGRTFSRFKLLTRAGYKKTTEGKAIIKDHVEDSRDDSV